MLDLYQLEELVAFSEAKTISKAAEMVGVSQPAFSRAMKLLEAELGVTLFNRTSNTITLSKTGERAVEYAKDIVNGIKDMREGLLSFERSLKTICIGSIAPAPLWRVTPILSELYEDKTIAAEMKKEEDLASGIKSGLYRFIITNNPIKGAGLSSMRLMQESLCFLLPLSHPLAKRRSLKVAELDGENMLLYEHIGFWKSIPEKLLPHSKFFVQSDSLAFEELVKNSNIPSFGSNYAYSHLEGKVVIPIEDEEAKVVFYITGNTLDSRILSDVVKRVTLEQ